jgi:hypothetical protein
LEGGESGPGGDLSHRGERNIRISSGTGMVSTYYPDQEGVEAGVPIITFTDYAPHFG